MLTQEQEFLVKTFEKELKEFALDSSEVHHSLQQRLEIVTDTQLTPLNPVKLDQPNHFLQAMKDHYHPKTACVIFHVEIDRVNDLIKESPGLYNQCVDYIAGMIVDLKMLYKKSFPIVIWVDSSSDLSIKPIVKTSDSRPPFNGKFLSIDTEIRMLHQQELWKSMEYTRENVLLPSGLYWAQVLLNDDLTAGMVKDYIRSC